MSFIDLRKGRESTNIEDRRVRPDINKPVRLSHDPTTVPRSKMLMDRYRAEGPLQPYTGKKFEQFDQYKPRRKRPMKVGQP